MNITFNIVTMLVIALISQGIFASLILILKRENRAANRYLSALTFLLSLWLCDTFFRVSGIYGQYPDFYFLPIYFSLGFGPLIYLYTMQLTGQRSAHLSRKVLHFIPVCIQFVFYLYLQTKNYAFRREFWFDIHRPYTYDIELTLSFLSLIIYLILSRRQIHRYRKQIENSFSDIHRIALRWLNQLHIVLFLLSFFWLIETMGRLVWGFYPATPFSAITIGFVIIFIAIGAILQNDLVSTTNTLNLDGSGESSDDIAVDQNEVERIQQILSEKELFLIPDLTLNEFSEYVGCSPRETSQLINKGLGISFIDFVNSNRVARFKELAKRDDLDHLSLLGIAFESGFNSKSTFNRVFKKMEGISPSSYLNKS